VPWFPLRHARFGSYAGYARVAAREVRHGIEVFHPRYPVIPKVGMRLAPDLMYFAVRRFVRSIVKQGFDVDLIDAHYFYPDGVAAQRLARDLGKPFVVTGRGTDLNLIPQFKGPRRRIQAVASAAGHIITVAAALKQYLLDMGVPESRVTVLRNGVDLSFFHPADDRQALRQALGFADRPMILSVGHLIERKGHHLVIEAMKDLEGMELVIAGDGEERTSLQQRVEAMGLTGRVHFAGRLDQRDLRRHYQAADALVLASSREGWANVLLESMACGTPVVATPVDGTPEVVAAQAAGQLTAERSTEAIVDAVQRLFADLPDRAQTRQYAEGFSWDDTSRGQLEIFENLRRAGESDPAATR
jgi:glycosyltransferase involved in cell wall biosynthesis